jgi:hypothetical protein
MNIIKNNPVHSVILDIFENTQPSDLNYIYRGVFTQNITEAILELAERNIDEINQPVQLRRRVYFLMVESLQNITRYQALKLDLFDKSGVFFIQKKAERYLISTGNLIENSRIAYVADKLLLVNKLTKDELKNYYRQILKNGKFTEEGGAGLGLIEMARKSGNRLTFRFEKLNDEYSYFYLHTVMPTIYDHNDIIERDLEFSLSKVVEIHKALVLEDISLVFNSGFSQESLLSLVSVIENQLIELGSLRKKVFNLMVEMLQNIIHHASKLNNKTEEKPGIFYLQEQEGEYILNTGNFIKNENVEALTQKIEDVNNMTKESLDHFYNTKLLDFNELHNNKAGLGIIDMRIKSQSDLKYFFKPINEQISFFNLEIAVETKF